MTDLHILDTYGYTMCPARSEFPTAGIEATLRDLLNILDGYLVGRPGVELGRARALLRRDRLCALERAAVAQIRRDTRGDGSPLILIPVGIALPFVLRAIVRAWLRSAPRPRATAPAPAGASPVDPESTGPAEPAGP